MELLGDASINRVAVFPAGKAPVFNLQEMLEQQELKRRIAEVNKIEAERKMNEISQTTTTEESTTTRDETTTESLETTTVEKVAEDEYEYAEDEFDVTFAPMSDDDGFIRRGEESVTESSDYEYEEEKPPMEIDLGSVQEV